MEGRGDRTTEGAPGSIDHRDAQPPPQAPKDLVFVKEGELRDRIMDSPSNIPEIDEPAAAAKEVAIPPAIGRADVVVVETDGMITIVECKLEGNPSSHGSVIGQALSYAAGLRGLSYDEFKERFERQDASLTKPFEDDADWDEASFRRKIEHNLGTGTFRLAIALDQMPPALTHTLAFLEGREPKGIQFSSAVLGSPVPKLDRHELIEMIRHCSGPSAARAAEELLEWALKHEQRLEVDYGRIDGVVKTRVDTLFRIVRFSEVRVSVNKITAQLDVRDSGAGARLEQDLERIGVPMEGKKARAALESLNTREFLTLMGRVLDDLTGPPQQSTL